MARPGQRPYAYPEAGGGMSARDLSRILKIIHGAHGDPPVELIPHPSGMVCRLTSTVAGETYPTPWAPTLVQGNASTPTEGTLEVGAGDVAQHGPGGTDYFTAAAGTTGTGLTALQDGFNVVYVDFLIGTSAALGIVSSATSEQVAKALVVSTATNYKRPLVCVSYDATTKQVTMVKRYASQDIEPPFTYATPPP